MGLRESGGYWSFKEVRSFIVGLHHKSTSDSVEIAVNPNGMQPFH